MSALVALSEGGERTPVPLIHPSQIRLHLQMEKLRPGEATPQHAESRSSDARFPSHQKLGSLSSRKLAGLLFSARLLTGMISSRAVNPIYCPESGGSERLGRTQNQLKRQD